MAPRTRTFTVRPEAHDVHRCYRCGRKLRGGERVTSTVSDGIAETRHAGRKCPPAYVRPVPPVPTRYVN